MMTAHPAHRALLIPLLVLGLCSGLLAGSASGAVDPADPTEETVTLVNQDSAGNATIRFDVNGEAIDAHDGQIQRFGDTYYLYGTSYDCGYEWNTPGAPFCGFVSYSSPDLVNWTPQGPLFDANTPTWQNRCDGATYGCYRPHVVFNEATGRYVLWINTYDVGVGYRVFTSTSPTGDFTEVDVPDLGAPEGPPGGVNYGDQQIFVDHDGQAYLAFTDWIRGGDLIVERLDATYTTGSGEWQRVNIRRTEAPTIFERDGTYYLTYSDPNRGYTTTGTGFVTASSPLGPWTGTDSTPDAWTVADGVLSIDGGDVGLSREGADWDDYTFRATVTPERAASSDYGQVGLVVRASTAGSYQWLIGNYPHPGATGGNLTKLIPGQGATTVPLPIPIVTGQTYDIAITVTGSTIETRIDGELVDTTTDATSPTGRVGFREGESDRERVTVESATVTAPDGTVLLSDDFTDGLGQWDRPEAVITGTNITTTSCGGQPADVLPIETADGTVYLYQSDVWMNAKANEALAKHYWQPLSFDQTGAIEPIECGASYDVTVPVGAPDEPPAPADVSTGHIGYRTHWDIQGGLARAQSFTVPEEGILTAVRFTSYQSGHPDAPLILELRPVGDNGTIGKTVASVEVPADEVSWAARWVELTPAEPLPVEQGQTFAVVARTESTQGNYGIAYSDTTPYAGGVASISHDSGATWSVETGRVLHLEADIGPLGPEPELTVDRVGGADRYATAAQIARLYPDGVDTVYVTTGENFYDALAGSPPASRGLVPGTQVTPDGDPAPVVLVKSNSIPPDTQAVLDEIDPADIVILGGTAAVSQGVQDELNATTTATVERIGGEDRYETAALLAAEYGTSDTVYVATGEKDGFPDALSGSALAGSEGVPVLLTKKDEVPAVVTSTIEDLGATNVIVLGGVAAIADSTYTELGGTDRLAGADRYATAVAITQAFGYGDGNDAPVVHVATGEKFPDALAGSALAGFQDAPVVLVKGPGAGDELPDQVLAELDRISPDQVYVLGGTAAVSQDVEDELNLSYPGWATD